MSEIYIKNINQREGNAMKKVIEISEKQEEVILKILEQVNSTLSFEKYLGSYVESEDTHFALTPAEKRSLSGGIDAIHDTSTNWEDLHN